MNLAGSEDHTASECTELFLDNQPCQYGERNCSAYL